MRFKVFAISVVTILLTACSAKIPDIDSSLSYDLGTVSKGKIAIADWPVRNLGDAPLKVEAVSTSCGCTTATLSSMVIPPHSQATLHVEYDSNAHETDKGRLERFIFISSDDPDENDVQISFTVFVKTPSQ